MNAANRGARILVGRCGDRTRVQNHDLGAARGLGAFQSARRELTINGGAVGLCGAATKILNVETAHAYILTYKV